MQGLSLINLCYNGFRRTKIPVKYLTDIENACIFKLK